MGNAWSGYGSLLNYMAKPNGELKLQQKDIKVSFDDRGLLLTSTKALHWENDHDETTFHLEKEDPLKNTYDYRLKIASAGKFLPKATNISLKGNSLLVKVDKEALPLEINMTPETKNEPAIQAATMKAGKELSLTKMWLSLGGIILLFLFSTFLLKRYGNRAHWLKSFIGNEKYKQGPLLETISKHTIGPKRQVVVLRAGGEFLLIGCSGDTMTLLTKIDEQSVEEENDLLETEIQNKTDVEFL